MKRFAIVVAMVAMLGLLVSPVWASDRPSVDELIDNYSQIQGEAAPQAMSGAICMIWSQMSTSARLGEYIRSDKQQCVSTRIRSRRLCGAHWSKSRW